MTNQEAVNNYQETMDKLVATLGLVGSADFNTVPFEGSWTAAQLGDHLLLSQVGFSKLVTGKIINEDRTPDEKVPMIKGIFLDFTRKFQSPDFIVPSSQAINQSELIGKLEAVTTENSKAANTHDLNKTCADLALPAMGTLTGLEWIYFMTYHTQRHIHQLENILKRLNEQ